MEKTMFKRSDIQKKNRPIFIALIFLPVLLIFRHFDNDIWFILNSGRYVVQHGIPHIEPFTLHEGFSFVMQQWLSGVIFWGAYSFLGEIGVRLVMVMIYVLMVFITYKICMKVSDGYFFASIAISFFVAIHLALWITTRPALFSTFILLLELYLLESFVTSNKKIYLVFLPLLSVLLINLQAAIWPMLFVLFAPYFIDSFRFRVGRITGQGYPKTFLFIMVGLMLVAGFANPYGFKAMTYLLRSYGHPEISNLVSEMEPAAITNLAGVTIFIAMFLTILIYVVHKTGTTKVRYVLLTLGTAYMALSSLRSFPFYAISAGFPLAYYLRNMQVNIPESQGSKREGILKKAFIIMFVVTSIFGIFYTPTEETDRETQWREFTETIEFIKAEGAAESVVLYTGYNDGGLAEFLGFSPYMDARAEVFVIENNGKDDVMYEYYNLQASRLYYKDFVNKYQFTHLIVTEKDALCVNLENDPDYRLAFSNECYILFEKNN